MTTWRDGTSSFFSADSMTAYSTGVATIRIVLLSLSATAWMLRTTPLPSPLTGRAAAAAAAALLTAACAGFGVGFETGGVVDGVPKLGGDTMVPAGVAGATLGTAGATCC